MHPGRAPRAWQHECQCQGAAPPVFSLRVNQTSSRWGTAQPHEVDGVAQELASFQNVHHVVINTGNFDLIISADFRGPEELSHFVREDLGNVQGLVSHETMVCLKTVRDTFTFKP